MTADTPLAGRVAVVTGGAGGIGSAVCRRLADAGSAVVVGFRRDEAAARTLAASLPGRDHSTCQADVTDGGSLGRFAAEIGARYGKVDILVNGVGTTRFVPHADLAGLDDALVDEIFRTNWRGPFATIRALKGLLDKSAELRRPDGTALVVNISSTAGVIGIGSNVAYCASKAALNAMTISLARALAPAIRVVSVSPGLVETSFIKGLDEAWRKEQISRTVLGRLASPDDVADAVVAVATTLRYSTGCIIPVDGGRLLS